MEFGLLTLSSSPALLHIYSTEPTSEVPLGITTFFVSSLPSLLSVTLFSDHSHSPKNTNSEKKKKKEMRRRNFPRVLAPGKFFFFNLLYFPTFLLWTPFSLSLSYCSAPPPIHLNHTLIITTRLNSSTSQSMYVCRILQPTYTHSFYLLPLTFTLLLYNCVLFGGALAQISLLAMERERGMETGV